MWRYLHAAACIPKECTTSGKLRQVSWSAKHHFFVFFSGRKILKLVLLLVRYQEQPVILWWPEAWQSQGGPSCTKPAQLCMHTRGNESTIWEEGDSAFLWISYMVQTALNGISISLPQEKKKKRNKCVEEKKKGLSWHKLALPHRVKHGHYNFNLTLNKPGRLLGTEQWHYDCNVTTHTWKKQKQVAEK